jgi:hypothetical protein
MAAFRGLLMDPCEIHDWQFGQLRWEEAWGWCAESFEWSPGQTVGLCIYTKLTEDNLIPDRTRVFTNDLLDREKELRMVAVMNAVNIDGFNEMLAEDDDRPEGWPFSAQSFADYIGLLWVHIVPDEASEFQYTTFEGPLFRVLISSDLSVSEAFFD